MAIDLHLSNEFGCFGNKLESSFTKKQRIVESELLGVSSRSECKQQNFKLFSELFLTKIYKICHPLQQREQIRATLNSGNLISRGYNNEKLLWKIGETVDLIKSLSQ